MIVELLSQNAAHGGVLRVCRHESKSTGTPMTFSLFLPPAAEEGPVGVVWYLSGLTCSHANVTDKGEYRKACAELGLAFIAPDTSPRGEGVPDDPDGAFDFGIGAGFYVDATEAPFDRHFRMWSYIVDELPELVATLLPHGVSAQTIMGHSMGGHGALTIGLTYPERYAAVSVFAPIVNPSAVPWGIKAFSGYLGDRPDVWRRHDAVALIENGARLPNLLVDQGSADQFLALQLTPDRLVSACRDAGMNCELRLQDGYDHSYYFVSTFMEDHLRWHAEHITKGAT